MKYSHAIDFAAEVENNQADTVTANEARQALLGRINRLTDSELLEAIDVYDTAPVEEWIRGPRRVGRAGSMRG